MPGVFVDKCAPPRVHGRVEKRDEFVLRHIPANKRIQLGAHCGSAVGGPRIYYGVVDGADLGRIVAAYPECF